MKDFNFKDYVASLTDEELAGEVLSWELSDVVNATLDGCFGNTEFKGVSPVKIPER